MTKTLFAAIAVLAMTPHGAHAQGARPQANSIDECDAASRQAVRMGYENNMKRYKPGTPAYAAADKQFTQSWLIQRYQQNVETCTAAFKGGRTVYYPS